MLVSWARGVRVVWRLVGWHRWLLVAGFPLSWVPLVFLLAGVDPPVAVVVAGDVGIGLMVGALIVSLVQMRRLRRAQAVTMAVWLARVFGVDGVVVGSAECVVPSAPSGEVAVGGAGGERGEDGAGGVVPDVGQGPGRVGE